MLCNHHRIGIHTSILAIVISLTSWESHHRPRQSHRDFNLDVNSYNHIDQCTIYRQTFNIGRTKSEDLYVSRLVLQLSLSNLSKPGVN